MLLFPLPLNTAAKTHLTFPSTTMSSEKASSILQGTKSLQPNQENTSLLNQHALPQKNLPYHPFQADLQESVCNVKQDYLWDTIIEYNGYLALHFLQKSISR